MHRMRSRCCSGRRFVAPASFLLVTLSGAVVLAQSQTGTPAPSPAPAIAGRALEVAPPPAPPAERQALAEDEAYRKAIDSVVWIVAFDRGWEKCFGTGVVVDPERGYILTAYHVIQSDRLATAVFPERDAEGAVIGKADRYLYSSLKTCAVEICDPKCDLALLRLKESAIKPKAMPLAARSPGPGAALFTIGNDAGAGVLWRYSGGSVRQVYDDRYRFTSGQEITARVVEMTVPINPGDSGGPIVNRYGELVGINSAIVPEHNQVHKGIDVSEIRAFLQKVQVKDQTPKAPASR